MALTDNIISYWKCDASSGNLSDSVGPNTLTNNGSTPFVAGKINNGIDLERGSSQYFSVADASQSGLDFGSAFSVNMWVKVESAPGGAYGLISKWDEAANKKGYGLYYFTGTKIRFVSADTVTATTRTQEWTVDLGTGTFKMVTFVFPGSGSGSRLYIDGVSQGDPTGTQYSSLANNTAPFQLGCFDNPASANFFDGIIDEVGVWERQLNSSEVTQLYNGGTGIQFPFIFDRYWVGGSGTWDGTASSKWALTSGGTGGESIPTSSNDVFFDANSGAVNITVATGNTGCKSLNATGFVNGAFNFTGDLSIAGSLIIDPGLGDFSGGGNVTLTASGVIQMGVYSGGTIYSLNSLIINASGTYIMTDDLYLDSPGGLVMMLGTLDMSTFGFTTSIVTSSGAGSYTLKLSSGIHRFTGTGTVWSLGSGATVTAQTSTLKMIDTSNTAITFAGGGKTYNNIWFSRGASTASNTITGSNSFANMKDDGSIAHSLLFTSGTTQTISTWNVSGLAGQLITISSAAGSTSTHALAKFGGGTISADYLSIQHSVATGANTWYAGTHSTNNQAVATSGSGWIFTDAPVSSAGMFLVM